MQAYKFLRHDGCTVITGASWPRPADGDPGPWVEVAQVRPCREGIHACRPDELAYWIGEELWEIELGGEVVASHHKVVAQRGRLVGRVTAWSPALATELCEWGAWRSRDLAETILRDADEEERAGRIGSAAALNDLAAIGARLAEELDDDDAGGTAAGYAGDVARLTLVASYAEAAFVAACATAHAAALDGSPDAFDAAFADERRHQSRWIAERLGLG